MEQLSPQRLRSSLSGSQADSERIQFNTSVRKHKMRNHNGGQDYLLNCNIG